MRKSVSRCARFALASAPLLALSLAGAALASDAGARSASTRDTGSVKLAQQGKAPAKGAAPAKSEQPQAPAPAPPGQTEEPAAWAVNCTDQGQKKLTCEMTQSLVDQKSRAQVAFISIRGATGGAAKVMLVRFFHGVFLPAGVSVKVDAGQPAPLVFQKSDRLGVYAALPLTDRLVADMKKGKDLKFGLQINQGEPFEVAARLNGFGPAFDRVSSMQ